jgi:hypothetical protein
MWKVYRQQTTDDGHQVMAIVHLDLWSRWTNKKKMSNRKQLQQTVKTQSVDKMLPYLLSFCMLSVSDNEKKMLIKSKCYFERN